jgi:hypothetical protein
VPGGSDNLGWRSRRSPVKVTSLLTKKHIRA